MAVYELTDYVSVETLEEILMQFYDATHIAANFSDYQGRPLAKKMHYCDLCLAYHESPEHLALCMQCDAMAGMQASLKKEPYLHICHAGLCDAAIPIIVGGRYIGMILLGQIRIPEEEQASLPDMSENFLSVSAVYPSPDEYRSLYENVPLMNLEQFRANVNLMQIIANYIAELGHQKVMQTAMMQKEVEAAEEKKEKAELQATLTRLELRNMSTHLNPQLLFEALNIIYQQALIEGASETSDMVLSVNTLLKRYIDHPDFQVPLAEELEVIGNLLLVRNLAQHYEISLDTDITPDCLPIRIPVAIIHSIVEHVFIYKLNNLEEENTILIHGRTDGHCLDMTISCTSDHLSFPKTDLTTRQNVKKLSSYSNTAFITLKNMQKTLSFLYNKDYVLEIGKKEPSTNYVHIRIPAEYSLPEEALPHRYEAKYTRGS